MYDLNVLWTDSNDKKSDLVNTLALLQEFGYATVAVNNIISGRIPAGHTCPIDKKKLQQQFGHLKILTRVTIIADDTLQQNLSPLVNQYDIIAVRPTSEKALQNVCNGSELIDLISLDCSKRMTFFLRHKTVCAGVEKGLKFEITYSSGTVSSESRKNIITNAVSLIRASRKRGLIISSEAASPLSVRGPYDVINLACLWGLDHMKAHRSIAGTAALVVKNAYLRANSYKQTIIAHEPEDKKRISTDTIGKETKRRKK